MARCGCTEECKCVLDDGDCTTVAGNGNPGAPYRVNLEIDPAVDNQAVCGEDGLYVPPPSAEVADTSCIALDGTGAPGDPITAEPIISPIAGNLLECIEFPPNPNPGLAALLNVLDSDCIDFSGDGTPGSPLTAEPFISDDPGNVFECRADGMYVPATSQGLVECRCTIERTLDQIVPASAGACSTLADLVIYDTVFDDPSGMADILSSSIIVPVGCEGIYKVTLQERDDPTAVNFGLSVVTIGVQIWVNNPGPTLIASQRFDRFAPTQHIFNLSVDFILNAGDQVYAIFNIHSNTGPTVPHTLQGGSFAVDRPTFLQVTKLGEV
jgi:hypothetical protein